MPYGFNNDKSRYDFAHDLQRITDLESLIDIEGESIGGIKERIEALETTVSGLTAANGVIPTMQNQLGIGNTPVARRRVFASPSDASGFASFRALEPVDLPSGIPASKIEGLGAIYNSTARKVSIVGNTAWEEVIGPGLGYTEPFPVGRYVVIAGAKWDPRADGFREIVLTPSDNFGDADKFYCGSTIEPRYGGKNDYRTHRTSRIMVSDGTLMPYLWARQNTGSELAIQAKIYAIRIR